MRALQGCLSALQDCLRARDPSVLALLRVEQRALAAGGLDVGNSLGTGTEFAVRVHPVRRGGRKEKDEEAYVPD